jgi:acyl phosphate:glycerol-3-phosphate acyltransferase
VPPLLKRFATLVLAYLAGAVPFSNVLAARVSGVDLREVGSGTVSGTGLYRVAGFVPLVAAGILDVAKGALVALVARAPEEPDEGTGGPGRRPPLRPPTLTEGAAAGLVVAGHNWSPYLDGAGGRGVSPALGAYAVIAPEASLLLLGGLVLGRLTRETGLGTFASQVALVPTLAGTRGRRGAFAGAAVLVPMLAKRLLGNGPPKPEAGGRVYLARLLYDRDDWAVA